MNYDLREALELRVKLFFKNQKTLLYDFEFVYYYL